MASIAVFPATFDPITNGHVTIAERAARLFDRLIIGVYAHAEVGIKQTLFGIEERVALVEQAVAHLPNAVVQPYGGLSVEFARAEAAQAIVRGLRVADDFEFERQMSMMNHHLAPEIETLLLVAHPNQAFVSASIVREVALMGGDVSGLVPRVVLAALARKVAAQVPVH